MLKVRNTFWPPNVKLVERLRSHVINEGENEMITLAASRGWCSLSRQDRAVRRDTDRFRRETTAWCSIPVCAAGVTGPCRRSHAQRYE